MKDGNKTTEQLISELLELRQRVAELEASENDHKRAEEVLKESEERYRYLFRKMLSKLKTRTMCKLNYGGAL